MISFFFINIDLKESVLNNR